MKVNAEVIDLRQDAPRASDVFWVDTNALLWATYTRGHVEARPYQIRHYPAFLNRALAVGASLRKCTLSLAELAHLIERREQDIFQRSQGLADLRPKKFRHNYPAARAQVVAEIEGAWAMADSLTSGASVGVTVDQAAVDAALDDLKEHGLDGYDLFMIQAIRAAGITQAITDDGDFGQVAGIQVFTANNWLINQARDQGKLRPR